MHLEIISSVLVFLLEGLQELSFALIHYANVRMSNGKILTKAFSTHITVAGASPLYSWQIY